MASLAGPSHLTPQAFTRRPAAPSSSRPVTVSATDLTSNPDYSRWSAIAPSTSAVSSSAGRKPQDSTTTKKEKEREERERKEEVNRKIASQKAISIILRREATKAVIEKKKGINSKKLLPRTVLEALHERITALRWESALNVFHLLREQIWYRPNPGIYIKLIVMLGKCKQPEKAQELFEAMVHEGCAVTSEACTALLSAYSRSGQFERAFALLERMKSTPNCKPDVHTYSILIKSCVQVSAFDKMEVVLSDMSSQGIKPNTVVYNILIDAYGRANKFAEVEATLSKMLLQPSCKPDVWTMNCTLRAFGSSGQIDTMEKCYEKFQDAGIEPDIKTFNVLLDSYGKTENYDKMSAVLQYMQKYRYSWTLVTYNVVIDAFGRAGDLRQMEFLFRLMQSERIKPDCVTFCSLVRAYGRAGKLDKVGSVWRLIENSDVLLDNVFFNCLVDAYGRMERLPEMKGVVEMMEKRGLKPDLITYRTMMKAYSIAGMSRQAREVNEMMRSLKRGEGDDDIVGELNGDS